MIRGQRIGWERLRAAIAQAKLRLPRDYGHLAALNTSYSYLREFTPYVLSSAGLAGGTAATCTDTTSRFEPKPPPQSSRRGTRANDPPGLTVHTSYSSLVGLLLGQTSHHGQWPAGSPHTLGRESRTRWSRPSSGRSFDTWAVAADRYRQDHRTCRGRRVRACCATGHRSRSDTSLRPGRLGTGDKGLTTACMEFQPGWDGGTAAPGGIRVLMIGAGGPARHLTGWGGITDPVRRRHDPRWPAWPSPH
jgi:hypothetical protein